MYDIIVIGAGIVGSAIAYSLVTLSKRPIKVLILDKESSAARHQTGHNSGIVHSGIYNRPGTLKAELCTQGRELLIQFCQQHNIPLEICGEMIVAQSEREIAELTRLQEQGEANGLTDLRWLSAEEIAAREPHIRAQRGLLIPQSGIVDFAQVTQAYIDQAKERGVVTQFNEEVLRIEKNGNSYLVVTQQQKIYAAHFVVSAAGLAADSLAQMTGAPISFRTIPFRGEFYHLAEAKRGLIQHLVSLVRTDGQEVLGNLHLGRAVSAEVQIGPSFAWAFKREGYHRGDLSLGDVKRHLAWPGFRKALYKSWRRELAEFYRSINKRAFLKSIQNYVPELQLKDLTLGASGVQAIACHRDEELVPDFRFLEHEAIFHVINAPEPAATASLALGQLVAKKMLVKMRA